MNLIDKYVAEVGKYLPRRNRADIEAEIRSTLVDMLEERKPASGTTNEETIVKVLKEYGAPRQVAESYTGPRYLIGPRVYPVFELVTKIVLAVLIAVTLAALGLSLARSSLVGPEFLKAIGEHVLDLIGGLITAFGNIVLVFAILERVLPAKEFEEEEEWDPAALAREPDPDRVKFSEQIVSIFFTAAFLIVLNLYPGIIGLGFLQDGEWVFISPLLSETFFSYLPWINILGVLEIALSVILLRQGVMQTWTRITRAVLELGNIALAVAMLRGPSLVALSAADFSGTPLADSAEVFIRVAGWVPTLVLTIIIIVSALEVAQTIYGLMKSRPASPYPVVK